MLPKASKIKAPAQCGMAVTEEQIQKFKEQVDNDLSGKYVDMYEQKVYVSGEHIRNYINNYVKVPRHLHHHKEDIVPPYVGMNASHAVTKEESNKAIEHEKRKLWLFVMFDAILRAFKGKPIEGNYQK